MLVFVPKEASDKETRVALVPESVKKLVALGASVCLETQAGINSFYTDEAYKNAGATIVTDRVKSLAEADMVARVGKPPLDQVEAMKPGAWHISFLDPFNEKGLIDAFAKAGVTAVSMEMIPRTTLAQKMDAISSQANLAGYFSIIKAAERLNQGLPMMMTPAGTISPARVFIVGVGVAGLQAIATAKRMGARVEAFDTRPVVEEQVKSLGAKFVKIDLGEVGQTDQGYAKALTPEQIELQQKGMAKVCGQSDIVVTTAKLFGRPAPRIITGEMLDEMRYGSVVVDLAVESGGNVEGSKLDEIVVRDNGVKIIGIGSLEGQVAVHASLMYSCNVYNFVDHFWDKESVTVGLNLEDDIQGGCVITHSGAIVHKTFKS